MTRSKPLKVYSDRVWKLCFEENYEEVTLFGLGAVIPQTIKLALYLQKEYLITYKVITYSVPVRTKIGEGIRSAIAIKILKPKLG